MMVKKIERIFFVKNAVMVQLKADTCLLQSILQVAKKMLVKEKLKKTKTNIFRNKIIVTKKSN